MHNLLIFTVVIEAFVENTSLAGEGKTGDICQNICNSRLLVSTASTIVYSIPVPSTLTIQAGGTSKLYNTPSTLLRHTPRSCRVHSPSVRSGRGLATWWWELASEVNNALDIVWVLVLAHMSVHKLRRWNHQQCHRTSCMYPPRLALASRASG